MILQAAAADATGVHRQCRRDSLLPEQRRQRLLDVIRTQGAITGRDAQALLNVSGATAARYLQELDRRGAVQKVRGGAIAATIGARSIVTRATTNDDSSMPGKGLPMPDQDEDPLERFTRAALAPVWDGYCADPFVLRTDIGYVMYGTSPRISTTGRVFQVLYSEDLITWQAQDAALDQLPDQPANTSYWAPEVAYHDKRYWMYYSSGRLTGTTDAGHHVRVAVATHPFGPFTDLQRNLTAQLPFAIDPSPFCDEDGNWWLYYATDVLDGQRPGTVIATQPLRDMTSLDGEPRIMLAATGDWQRFQRNRAIYGGTYDWHTVEGPHVVHRDGRYWMFHSGGSWRTSDYGVSVATAEHPTGPWEPYSDGPFLLKATGTGLIGPGHNSLVTDPTGTDHLVFHAFDPERYVRQPYTTPLLWTANGPRTLHSHQLHGVVSTRGGAGEKPVTDL